MRFIGIMLLSLGLAGCATAPVYNPMQVANQQELLLNESGLKAVANGMTLDQVHQIMGQKLIIGYQYQAPDYKPLTIPNPYKSETIKGTGYFIEYYIQSIVQPDGTVSDDELMPLVFKDGRLIGRGWPLANSLRP
ncbi:MAG: DUF3192 domain-containing protein [Candidatus Omnitrophica bacterium]|nr:DUF3192 domain-containing protein [Candidatus Omnitrophota bacterium]MDE2215411.1 DUF3192 domain-containing protein [Candidatus Omnitrophota bacterium]